MTIDFSDILGKPAEKSAEPEATKAVEPVEEPNIVEIITPDNPELHALAVKLEEARNGRNVDDIPVLGNDPYWDTLAELRKHYQENK